MAVLMILLMLAVIVVTGMFSVVSTSVYFCKIPDEKLQLNNTVNCQPELPALEGFYNVKLSLVVHNSIRPKNVLILKYNKDQELVESFKALRQKTSFNQETIFQVNKNLSMKAGEHLKIKHENRSPLKEYLSGYFVLTQNY